MKLLTVLVIIFTLGFSHQSKAESLTEDAALLKQAYDELQLRKRDGERQLKFVRAFPRRARDFNRLFNSPSQDQLWDGSRYIFELEQLAQSQPNETFGLMLQLASELKWAPDAPNYLQFVLMKMAIDNPFAFADQFAQLTETQRSGVVNFLAKSNKGPAIGFHQFIEILNRINKTALAEELSAGLR